VINHFGDKSFEEINCTTTDNQTQCKLEKIHKKLIIRETKQESSAVARKPRDAAAVLFGLKFADNIHYKFKSSQASKARLQSSKHTGAKQFNAKWRFKESRVFWSQWKGDKALSNTIQPNNVHLIS